MVILRRQIDGSIHHFTERSRRVDLSTVEIKIYVFCFISKYCVILFKTEEVNR